MSATREVVAKNLRYYRKATGKSQKEVSAILEIDNSTLSKYEMGTREPDFDTVKKLADLYGVAVSDILGDIEEYIDEEAKRLVERINKLPEDVRKKAYNMLDAIISEMEK